MDQVKCPACRKAQREQEIMEEIRERNRRRHYCPVTRNLDEVRKIIDMLTAKEDGDDRQNMNSV